VSFVQHNTIGVQLQYNWRLVKQPVDHSWCNRLLICVCCHFAGVCIALFTTKSVARHVTFRQSCFISALPCCQPVC